MWYKINKINRVMLQTAYKTGLEFTTIAVIQIIVLKLMHRIRMNKCRSLLKANARYRKETVLQKGSAEGSI